MIARQQKPLFSGIVQSDGEHAVKSSEAVAAPPGIGVENGLSVRATAKHSTGTFQFTPQIGVVVNFAVVGNPIASGRIEHGLMACSREIKNGKPSMPERQSPPCRRHNFQALIIGTTLCLYSVHSKHSSLGLCRFGAYNPG